MTIYVIDNEFAIEIFKVSTEIVNTAYNRQPTRGTYEVEIQKKTELIKKTYTDLFETIKSTPLTEKEK